MLGYFLNFEHLDKIIYKNVLVFFIFEKLMFQSTKKSFLMYFISEQYIEIQQKFYKQKFGNKMFEVTKIA
jgi:hypothetical protein